MAGWVAGTHHARTRPRSRFDSAGAGPPSNNACIPPPSRYSSRNSIGAWLSLVERLVRDQEVAGSNPVAPTPFCLRFRRLFYCFDNGILWGVFPILGVSGLRKGDKLGGQNPFASKNTMLPSGRDDAPFPPPPSAPPRHAKSRNYPSQGSLQLILPNFHRMWPCPEIRANRTRRHNVRDVLRRRHPSTTPSRTVRVRGRRDGRQS